MVVVLIVSIFFSRYGIHAQESSERHPVTVDVSAIASDRSFAELEKRIMGILKYEKNRILKWSARKLLMNFYRIIPVN